MDIPCLQDDKNDVPMHKRQNNMILDVAGVPMAIGTIAFFVDSSGQISSNKPHQVTKTRSMKVWCNLWYNIYTHQLFVCDEVLEKRHLHHAVQQTLGNMTTHLVLRRWI